MRRVVTITLSALALSLGGAVPIASAGQPNANCDTVAVELQPAGFQTAGFTHAALVYAGSPETPSAENSQSGNAVSQYDIACIRRAAGVS
jgi:hypothetical protein